MAFDWTSLIPGYKPPNVQGTPPYVPGGTGGGGGGGGTAQPQSGGGASQQGTPSAMQQFAPWLVGGGLTALGAVLGNRAQNQNTQMLQQRVQVNDQLARDEMARKEYYSSIVLPSLMQAMGLRNPNLAAMALQKQRALPGYGGAMPQQQAQGAQQSEPGSMGNMQPSSTTAWTVDKGLTGTPRYEWKPNEDEI